MHAHTYWNMIACMHHNYLKNSNIIIERVVYRIMDVHVYCSIVERMYVYHYKLCSKILISPHKCITCNVCLFAQCILYLTICNMRM